MRRTKYNTIVLVAILILLSVMPTQSAEESQLSFVLYDEQGNIPSTYTLFVGTTYNLYVTTTDLNDPLYNVTVVFPWGTETTTIQQPILTLTSVQYQLYAPTFTISASKEGYLSVQKTFLVSNQKISLDAPSSIKEENTFLVTVKDQDGQPLKSVTLLFSNETDIVFEQNTDNLGQVKFTAPTVDATTTYSISASKIGYQPVTTTISVLNRIADTENQYVSFIMEFGPILLSILAVVVAVWLVDYRNKQRFQREKTKNHFSLLRQKIQPKKQIPLALSKIPPKRQQPKQSSQIQKQTPIQHTKTLPTHTKIEKTNSHRIEEIHIHSHSTPPTTAPTKNGYQHTTSPPQSNTQTIKNKQKPYWIQGDEQLHNKIDQLINENNKKKQKAKHLTATNTSKQVGE